jgi:hypothetical protein
MLGLVVLPAALTLQTVHHPGRLAYSDPDDAVGSESLTPARASRVVTACAAGLHHVVRTPSLPAYLFNKSSGYRWRISPGERPISIALFRCLFYKNYSVTFQTCI